MGTVQIIQSKPATIKSGDTIFNSSAFFTVVLEGEEVLTFGTDGSVYIKGGVEIRYKQDVISWKEEYSIVPKIGVGA